MSSRKIRAGILSLILFIAGTSFRLTGQVPDSLAIGIHQAESEYYGKIYGTGIPPGTEESPSMPVTLKSREESKLLRMVYGWHPYWTDASAYLSYDYEALSHIAYFSMEVDTATGGYTTLRGWNTTPIISYAHQKGVKVTLTVTNFGTARNTELLTDTVKQWTLINTVIDQLRSRNGDGVNFDFESVPSAMKQNMVSFCRRAVRGIKAELPDAEISLATPAVNWSSGWDLGALASVCDYLIMMGYNYYWSSSSTAGPVAPLAGETYNVTRSVDQDYLAAGVPPAKLLLGVPWYGYDWPVVSSVRKAATTGTGTSRTYSSAEGVADNYGKTMDEATGVPWVSYLNGSQWRQLWYDDSLSLALKNKLIEDRDLAGIGIWALSYDGGTPELWEGLKAAFLPPVPTGNRIIDVVPNPVYDKSVLTYSVLETGLVTLRIYNLSGKLVASPVNMVLEPGFYTAEIDAAALGTGYYICILRSQGSRSSMKISVVTR